MDDEELLLREQLAAHPERGDLWGRLCQVITAQGRAIPPDVEEGSLRALIAADPSRNDLAFRLCMLSAEQGKPVAPRHEEMALRHALAQYPGRLDLIDRLTVVILDQVLACDDEEAPQNDDGAVHPLILAAREALASARRDATAGLPGYGSRWHSFVERMGEAIATFRTPVEAIRYAQGHIGFDHRRSVGNEAKFFSLYQRELALEFPGFADAWPGFRDVGGSLPATRLMMEGRPVSNILYYHARTVMSCLALVPRPRVVLEIGGGYGAPARTWLTNPVAPPDAYIIVDIPESLFFSQVLLSRELGEENVFYVSAEKAFDPALLTGKRAILCPLSRLSSLLDLEIDLVINTGSMQEMSPEWIEYYMEWLERQRPRYFYSLNYALQPVGALAESVNLWSPRPPPAWIARLLRFNPAFQRMQGDRHVLEALWERSDTPLSRAQALDRLAILAERRLTGETVLEALDVIRRRPDPDLMLACLRRIVAELPWRPKEALWLADVLSQAEISPDEAQEVAALRRCLVEEREGGIEGTTGSLLGA